MIILNQNYNEHCLATMARMPNDYLDMSLHSPPYDDLRTYNGYHLPVTDIAKELYRVTKPGGVVIWVIGDKTIDGSESLSSFKQAITFVEHGGFRLRDTMLYVKNNPIPGDCGKRYRQTFEYMFCFSKGTPKAFNPIMEPTKSAGKAIKAFRVTQAGRGNTPLEDIGRETKLEKKHGNIFSYTVGSSSATDPIAFKHPAIFPERLALDQVRSWSNPGDIVYDGFMGSGTTAIAAEMLDRFWIGSEVSQEYIDIARIRLLNYRDRVSLIALEDPVLTGVDVAI